MLLPVLIQSLDNVGVHLDIEILGFLNQQILVNQVAEQILALLADLDLQFRARVSLRKPHSKFRLFAVILPLSHNLTVDAGDDAVQNDFRRGCINAPHHRNNGCKEKRFLHVTTFNSVIANPSKQGSGARELYRPRVD